MMGKPPALSGASVSARLQYLACSDDGSAVYFASQAGGNTAEHDGQYVWHDMTISDARLYPLSLNRQGFALASHETAITDFHDGQVLATTYDAELEALLTAHTGARRVHVFDHTRRATSDNVRRQQTMREPSAVIHNDYTAWSAEKRLAEILPDESATLMLGRVAIVNVWRSIAGTVETMPMAFCDSTTLDPDDIVAVTRQAKGRIGQIQMAHFNPAHRWCYFPRMTADEVALIKTYDTAKDGRNRFTIHTAFADPSSADDAPPRQSIESRAFLFF